jgi:hypothetical protein
MKKPPYLCKMLQYYNAGRTRRTLRKRGQTLQKAALRLMRWDRGDI